MPSALSGLVDRNYIPHGICLLWQPELLWLHVISDITIAIAYYTIPFALIYFSWQRSDLAFRGLFLFTGAFILACGTTHVMAVLTLWYPDYWLEGAIKLVTALVSIGTAFAMWQAMPSALALPSIGQLEKANDLLAHEFGERQRISRALHDQIGQELTGMSLLLKSIEPALQTETAQKTLRQLQSLAAEMSRSMHNVAWELRPTLPHSGGLRAALERYVFEWSEKFGLLVDFRITGVANDDLSPLVETKMFQIVREAFTNILKHAAATRVGLVVERTGDRLRVVIKDNGKGLDRDVATTQGQLGLLGIRERATLLGGSLSIESASLTGTTLTIIVPLAGATGPRL